MAKADAKQASACRTSQENSRKAALQQSTHDRSRMGATRDPETCLAAAADFSLKPEIRKTTPYRSWGNSVTKCVVKAKTICALISATMLSGCSSTYDLRAFSLNEEIAFVPEDEDIWGKPAPECFYSIYVSIVDGPSATPAAGDSLGMVQNGVYWHQSFAVTSCDNPFPITYGADLQGPSFREGDQHEVEAKPLLPGFTYEVSASSNGSEYGGGMFRLAEDGSVGNLRR